MRAAVPLEDCARVPGWNFHGKSALLLDCCAMPCQEVLGYPSLCSFVGLGSAWSRGELRNHQLAGFGNQLGNAPCWLGVPPRALCLAAAPGQRRSCRRGSEALAVWAVLGALLLLSNLTHPHGSWGHLSLTQPLLWRLGELWTVPLSRGATSLRRLKHRDVGAQSHSPEPQTDTCALSWALSQAPIFPFPLLGQRPGLSQEEGRAFPARKEAICEYSLAAWSAQEAAGHWAPPRPLPLHVAISTSAGPGALPGLAGALVPLSCSRRLGSAAMWGLCPPSWGQAPRVSPSCGGIDQAVVLTGTGQQRGGFSQHKHKVSLCLSCFLGCFLGWLPGSSGGLKRLLL